MDTNQIIIGTCSICGGPVVAPKVFWSIIPPTPVCSNCGAVAVNQYGPVIPMTLHGKTTTSTSTTLTVHSKNPPSDVVIDLTMSDDEFEKLLTNA